jgi:hypothetical protein
MPSGPAARKLAQATAKPAGRTTIMTRPADSGSGAGPSSAARFRLHEVLRDCADRNLDVSDRQTVMLATPPRRA